jgi:hypothetical protein
VKEILDFSKEETAADVVKVSAKDEGSGNELAEQQKSTITNRLLSSAKDGTDAVISHVGSSKNHELRAYCVHLRTVGDIQNKEQQVWSVQSKLASFFKIKNRRCGLFRQNLRVSSK